MKKFLFFSIAALMLIAAASCDKNEIYKRKPAGWDGITPMPEAVDLGIVVNGKTIKWASQNLGAAKFYNYGDWYAWGETITYYSSLCPVVWGKRNESDESVMKYNWRSYIYASGDKNKLTKYCPNNDIDVAYWDMSNAPSGPDGQTVLLPSDDPVRKRLGEKWRMPTWEELDALMQTRNNPDYRWTFGVRAKNNGNSIYDGDGNMYTGVVITLLSTGASIYLPTAGISGVQGFSRPKGPLGFFCSTDGFYWSSTLDTESDDNHQYSPASARALHFNQGSDCVGPGWIYRCYGLSIRPVTESE